MAMRGEHSPVEGVKRLSPALEQQERQCTPGLANHVIALGDPADEKRKDRKNTNKTKIKMWLIYHLGKTRTIHSSS